MWDEVISLLNTHQHFLLTTHVHPDGDAIGALVGLGLHLEELGKTALLVNDDPVPRIYQFLDPEGRVRHYEPVRDDPEIAACDMAVVLDVGSLDRIGRLAKPLRRHEVPIACVDHHVTNNEFGHINYGSSGVTLRDKLGIIGEGALNKLRHQFNILQVK